MGYVDLVMKLCVRDVDALVHAELIQVCSVRRIEGSAAVVLGIGVVVGNALSAAIVIGTLYATGDFLRAALVSDVLVGGASVVFG